MLKTNVMDDPLATLKPLDPSWAAFFSWANEGPARTVMEALEKAAPGASRYVGGCVRDSLFGQTPKDIDIATQLTPDKVTAALHAAGLGAAPTGLEHGTVTGIAEHVGVEVTTLRSDVSTDGRRATVAFTKEWKTDAERRDFTMNAIYLTPDKKLHDPVNGFADAQAGRVRFIGDAQLRIREDYLRILRFFRFSARFVKEEFDAVGLLACKALKDGVSTLSAERIGDEMVKILSLPTAAKAVEEMKAVHILQTIWPHEPDTALLSKLKAIDATAPASLGLAALYGDHDRDGNGKTIDTTLRLSNAQGDRRKAVLKNASLVSADMGEQKAHATLYRLGADAWRDALWLAQAKAGGDAVRWDNLRALPDRWTPPNFPIGGKEVLALGVEKGPEVAQILSAVEAQWIAEGFPEPERAQAILKSVVSS